MTSREEATGPGIRDWGLRHRSPRQRIAFAGPGVGVGRFSLSQQLVTDASVLMYWKTSPARSSACPRSLLLSARALLFGGLLLVAATSPAVAQDGPAADAGERPEEHSYVAIGVSGTDLGPLNDRLSANGYPTFSTLSSDWQLGQSRLGGGPDASMQGPFLRLTVGGVRAALGDATGDKQ